ncbi:MAG: DUF4870 domain-containing protein [Ignavibacteria bacterium]|nr:DUF4870 domain-containing protein [Ignavibacteria bacterium]
MEDSTISQEERLLSLFSHFSIMFGGFFVPLIFWLINREKSKYVSFHSLQALWFQIVYVIFILSFVVVFLIVFFAVGSGTGMFGGKNEMPPIMIIIMVIFYILLFVVIFGAMGYALYAGYKSYKGAFVKYPVIGNIIYKRIYS